MQNRPCTQVQYELKLYESHEGDFATISILPVLADPYHALPVEKTSFEITIFLPCWTEPKPIIRAEPSFKVAECKTSAELLVITRQMAKWEKAVAKHEAEWGGLPSQPACAKAGIFMTALGIKSLVVNGREEARGPALLALKAMVKTAFAKITEYQRVKDEFCLAPQITSDHSKMVQDWHNR